jgi:hypothetical protein
MPLPPAIVPAKPRRRRKRRNVSASTTPPALMLVGAAYDASLQTVTLTFGRAVDVSGFAPEQVSVIDGPNAQLFQATEIVLDNPTTATVALTQVDTASGEEVLLDATAANGIVAVGDAEAWAGVTNLELPFP